MSLSPVYCAECTVSIDPMASKCNTIFLASQRQLSVSMEQLFLQPARSMLVFLALEATSLILVQWVRDGRLRQKLTERPIP